MYNSSAEFYRSRDWQDFRQNLMFERTNERGEIICAECGNPIVKAYDCIAHHVQEITLDTLNDCRITLNPDNIELLHARCHNLRHARFGFCKFKKVFLVYGCPLAGKSTYVKSIMGMNDIKVDIDDIYYCVSSNPKYIKPNSISDVAFALRDSMLDIIKTRRGKWQTAYIIGGFPFKGERERTAAEYGAECIYIDCTQEEAIARLQATHDGRDVKEWGRYINNWFNRYQE